MKITATQQMYIVNGFDFKSFKKIMKARVPLSQKSVFWSFFTKTLPIFHKEKFTKPLFESTEHIFFENDMMKQIVKTFLSFLECKNFDWTFKNALHSLSNASDPKVPNCFPGGIYPFMNTAWWIRNQGKHNSQPTIIEALKYCYYQWVLLLKEATLSSKSLKLLFKNDLYQCQHKFCSWRNIDVVFSIYYYS